MTKFFVYLEKVLTNVNFFTTKDLLDEINNPNLNSALKNQKFETLKKEKFENGDVYVYYLNDNPVFNFKIGDIIYELLLTVNYNQSLLKLGDKLTAMEKNIDKKVAGRYGVSFYPKNLPGVKYDNVKLSTGDSAKLFDYLRTCAEKLKKKKFYFDGANTKKENEVLKKIHYFTVLMEKNSDTKDKNELFDKFLISLKSSEISLDQVVIEKIKKIINKNDFKKMLNEIVFLMRDELNINFNTRERYFVKLLKKEGIKATIGKVYNRTIFFEL